MEMVIPGSLDQDIDPYQHKAIFNFSYNSDTQSYLSLIFRTLFWDTGCVENVQLRGGKNSVKREKVLA